MMADSKTLTQKHIAMLTVGSAIAPDVIQRRGYYSIASSKSAADLGFNHKQARQVDEKTPALIIPYYGVDGEIVTHIMRPDNPRVIENKRNGKSSDGTYPNHVLKYEMIKGAGNVLDCHPDITKRLSDPAVPLILTEGAKKADSLNSQGYCAINLNGVWGWRGSNKSQGKTALPDFEAIALNGRKIILLFDSDVRDNESVQNALRRLRSFLMRKGANVVPVLLPPSDDEKAGIDDLFASGFTKEELDQIITYFEVFTPDLGGASRKRWTTEDIQQWYEKQGLFFRINDMSETLMVNSNRMDDTLSDVIDCALLDEGIPVIHGTKARVAMGHTNRFHPLRAYFQALEYDGKTDHILELAAHFEDKEHIFQQWLRKWLVGAVAKALEGAQNFVLTLDGKQGIGKSYFAKWLCPLDDYFTESPIRVDDKDSELRQVKNFIWEIGELGHVTSKQDVEALKRFLTLTTIEVRPSYGRNDIIKLAVSSFIGTVNNAGGGFLSDPTGNRRYAVATITDIDFRYTEMDVNHIWAQAYHLYVNGEDWRITGNDAERQAEINSNYESEEPLEALINQHFDIDSSRYDEETNSRWCELSTAAILTRLKLDPSRRDLSSRVSIILKSAGLTQTKLKRKDGGRFRMWKGIVETPQGYTK